jgi:hypothetical protein
LRSITAWPSNVEGSVLTAITSGLDGLAAAPNKQNALRSTARDF